MEGKYRLSKTCKNCNYSFEVELSKIDAAFTQRTSIAAKTPCPQCRCTAYTSCSRPLPAIDQELMTMWATNPNLCFYEQDEDLMLADIDNLDLIKQFILHDDILASKCHTLVEALCVMIYDKSNGWQQALDFLKQCPHLVLQVRSTLSAYIGKTVFPKIGLQC